MEKRIKIKNILVGDRIRKEFGDIESLAQDIRENGLINPPVVLPADEDGMYTLLAGERRLRAMKSLGWTETEVRIMEVRDAEQELKIEINENKLRKGFSYDEVYESGIKLERVVAAKARERQATSTGGTNPQLRLNSDRAGRTDDEVAKELGIGRDKWRRIKTIIENKEFLDPDEVALWDEGKLSVNKAFQSVKARLAEAEARVAELESKPPEYIEVEVPVTPPDYDEAKVRAEEAESQAAYNKRYADLMESKNKDLREKLVQSQTELKSVKDAIEVAENSQERNVRLTVGLLKSATSSFIEQYGGFVWLADYIESISDKDLNDCINALHALSAWAEQMIINLTKENYNEI